MDWSSVAFEWDERKSNLNEAKHGLGFRTVSLALSSEPFVHFPSRYEQEDRHVAIVRIENIAFAVIFTRRGDKIRVISARRARREERRIFEIAFGAGN
ncbi:MAG: BrnT family toxin [Pseudomonadota bacterium]